MSRRQGRPGLAHDLLPHKLYLRFRVNADGPCAVIAGDVRLLQTICGEGSRHGFAQTSYPTDEAQVVDLIHCQTARFLSLWKAGYGLLVHDNSVSRV